MPWKECHIVDDRLRFVARVLDGEKMAPLCREFGISRKTGYKIFDRYKDCGLHGLTDRSRRPYRHANQLPLVVETPIVALKREYPSWGAPKIRERLRRRWPGDARPAISTVHAVLDRHGLVQHRRRRRVRLQGTGPVTADRAQRALVCGLQGRVHARRPALLLSADRHRLRQTRYLIACERLSTTRNVRLHGLRARVHGASGCPARFAPTTACRSPRPRALRPQQARRCGGSAWAFGLERISAGHPEQNGRHERMHLTLKHDATKPAAANVLQQQARFDTFRTSTTTSGRTRRSGCRSRRACTRPSPRPYRGARGPRRIRGMTGPRP